MYTATIPASDLKQAVNTVFKVVPKSSSLRILDNIKISGNGKLEFYSTDLDAHGYSFIKIPGQGEEEITVNGKTFFNICKALPKRGNVEIQIDGDTLKLNGASITGTDTRDYPGRPEFDREAVSGIIPTRILREAFEKVAFAAAKDESRACLAGVLFHADKSGFEFIATDGHRFAKKAIREYQAVRDFPTFSMIVPPHHVLSYLKTVSDPFIKITCQKQVIHEPKRTRKTYIPLSALKDVSGDLLEYKARNMAKLSDEIEPIRYIRFNTRDSSLIVKLIEGPYPDYRRVIPANNPKSASFHRETLLSEIESLIPLANQKTYLIRFSFGAENSVSVINKEIGAEKSIPGIAREYLPGPEETGETAFQIGFNAKYLAEILRKINIDKVRFQFNSPISGCLITEENSEELFLLMPLRIIEM